MRKKIFKPMADYPFETWLDEDGNDVFKPNTKEHVKVDIEKTTVKEKHFTDEGRYFVTYCFVNGKEKTFRK